MPTLELKSFDGTTLLGFLASAGALRLLHAHGHEVRLAFDERNGHALLESPTSDLQSALVEATCSAELRDAWVFRGPDGTVFNQPSDVPVETIQAQLAERLGDTGPSVDRRLRVDILSAVMAGEADEEGSAVSTDLRAVGGGQLQYFKQVYGLFGALERDDLAKSLSEPWSHADESGGLRLAPEEDRSYALRANNPSAEGAFGERAASVLALQAHTFFPVLPQGGGLTVGFDRDERSLRWPLWSPFCSVPTVAALIAAARDAERTELERRGVFRVMTARRFTRGQYRNFAPAMALW